MKRLLDRAGWVIAGVLALGIIAFAARVVAGGPLDPPAAPTSTMQTLDNIPPAWDRRLDSTNGLGDGCESSRFKCVLLGEGVLDVETGLVWARDANAVGNTHFWFSAIYNCQIYNGGDRRGWRLPTAPELLSLFDESRVSPNASVPAGSPFTNVLTGQANYWTATDEAGNSTGAYEVGFLGGEPGLAGYVTGTQKNTSQMGAWCVRGAVTQ
jgi:hypothetical protein